MDLLRLKIEQIKRSPAPLNPKRQGSLKKHGQLVPVAVVKARANGYEYEIQDGNRRLADSLALGQDEIMALVYDDASEEDNLLRGLALNLTRSESLMIDARRMKRLITEFKWTQQRLGEALDLSQGKISQYLGLVDRLHPHFQQQLELGLINFTVARVLCRMSLEAQDQLVGQSP